MSIKVVIFDNDGVLIKEVEMFSTRLIKERNLDKRQVDRFFKEIFVPLCSIGKADLREELEKVLPLWGIDDDVDSILKYWFECENNVDKNIKDLILRFREKGIKCYLATNHEKYRVDYMIKYWGFGQLFDGIFSSGYLGVKKPEEEFYKKVYSQISKEKINKNEILYIDDEEKNIIAGKRFGFNGFLYKNFDELKIELKKLQLI